MPKVDKKIKLSNNIGKRIRARALIRRSSRALKNLSTYTTKNPLRSTGYLALGLIALTGLTTGLVQYLRHR